MKVLRIYHAGRTAAHRERDRALVRAGAEVTLVVPASWPGPDELSTEPFEIVELPVRRPGDVNRHTYLEPARIAELAARCDVVDLHAEPFSAVVRQCLRLLAPHQPVVAYAAQNIDKRFPPPFAQWERHALARLDGIYPCSRQAASVVAGKGYRGTISVLPLGPAPIITPGEQRLPARELRVLFVGRLVPEKGVLDAVRAVAAAAFHGSLVLEIVGGGPEGATARALADELGVGDCVVLRSWLPASELAHCYRRAHVLLAPSRATRTWVEQFGRMVVEAQAGGAVVVGYASGSLPEVVGDAGVLVPEGDHEALAAGLVALWRDPARWAQLRDAGLARVRAASWDAVSEGQFALYREAQRRGIRPRRVRPRRHAAVETWGEPARIAGGVRPFALPVLREDNAVTRALASALDRMARAEHREPPERVRVVYLDHVARMSGGELALLRLIQAMPDVDAHVILGEDGPLRPALEQVGATVEVLAMHVATRDLRRDAVGSRAANLGAAASTLGYVGRLTRRLRQLEPDLVHTNSLKSGYYGSLAARAARLPVVWHLRDRVAEDYLPRRAVSLTRFALRWLPNAVVANSGATLCTAGRHVRRGFVVASPVTLPSHLADPAHAGRRSGHALGMVGRLAPWKGQDVFLQAIARLGDPRVTARIVGSAMFGEDGYEANLRALAERLGLSDQVTFVGYTSDIAAELARMDVLVHASVTPEPFGQVVVEGMAVGLPVVATDAGGPAEIITDGVDGLLVAPADVDALTDALRRLADDPALRTRLGASAMRRARDFAPAVVAEQIRAVYREVLTGR